MSFIKSVYKSDFFVASQGFGLSHVFGFAANDIEEAINTGGCYMPPLSAVLCSLKDYFSASAVCSISFTFSVEMPASFAIFS